MRGNSIHPKNFKPLFAPTNAVRRKQLTVLLFRPRFRVIATTTRIDGDILRTTAAWIFYLQLHYSTAQSPFLNQPVGDGARPEVSALLEEGLVPRAGRTSSGPRGQPLRRHDEEQKQGHQDESLLATCRRQSIPEGQQRR